MKRNLRLLATLLLLASRLASEGKAQTGSSSGYVATYHIFPEFADGRLDDGSYYRTTLMISNPSDTDRVTCALQLHGLTVPGFDVNYSMEPGGWVISPTGGTQNFQAGYATLECSANVEPLLMYSYYDSDGIKLSEATTFSSPPAETARLMGDQPDGSRLAVVIANDSDETVSYTVLAGYVGTSVGGSLSNSVTLGPRTSVAKFLNEIVPGIPPNTRSDILISSKTSATTAIGFRFTGNVLATMPEASWGIPGPASATSFAFPQFAEGKFIDGSYFRTAFMYQNPSGANNCTGDIHGGIIGGFNLLTTGPGAISLPLLADFVYSNSTPPLATGYTTIQCSAPMEVRELYSYYDKNGFKLSEATAFPSPAAPRVQILADTRGGVRVALAIANDSDQSDTYTINLYDARGALVGTAIQTLSARTNLARFIDELVKLPANYYGPVSVTSRNQSASIIGMRFTGSVFTTIPETIR